MNPSSLSALALSALLTTFATATHAADYPTKVIKIVVPYSVGGSTDILARALVPAPSVSRGFEKAPADAVCINLSLAAITSKTHCGDDSSVADHTSLSALISAAMSDGGSLANVKALPVRGCSKPSTAACRACLPSASRAVRACSDMRSLLAANPAP